MSDVMTDDHKEILKANYQNVVDNVRDIDDVVGHLYGEKLISTNLLEKIQEEKGPRKRARELMMNLPRFGDTAYYGFLLALLKTNQMDLAKSIDPNYNGPDEMDSDNMEYGLIEQYEFEQLEIRRLKAAEILRVVSNNGNYRLKSPVKHPNSKLGRVLVINNREFKYSSLREGSEVDVELIQNCFERLNFDVMVHTNKKAEEIKEILREESARYSGENSDDVFFLFLMSHGVKDYVCGTDDSSRNNKLVSIEEVQGFFDGEKCPGLKNKPKLFFIQACQKNERENIQSAIEKGTKWVVSKPKAAVDNQAKIKSHKYSDMFLMKSTVPGYLSWRHSLKGSYFIRTVIYEIATRCHKEDLLSMMTEAQRLLTGIEICTDRGPITQQPEVKSTLRFKFYFLP